MLILVSILSWWIIRIKGETQAEDSPVGLVPAVYIEPVGLVLLMYVF